jgi:uncharacterized protein
MSSVRDSADGATFAVRIHPRARRTAVTGVLGEGAATIFKVALSAPPIEGRANEALTDYMCELFAVPRYAVSVLSGALSRNKVLRISGRTAHEVARALDAVLSGVPVTTMSRQATETVPRKRTELRSR